MRARTIVGCLVAALAVAWSGPAAAQKVAQPPELLMSVGIGPDNTLDSLRAFANAMQPGVGMMMSGQMVRRQLAGMAGATSLDGLDEKAATFVLAVDGGPALKGAAVVGKILDEKQLAQSAGPAHVVKKNGWAVVGPKLVAEKVAPFAFASLVTQPTISGPPVATVYTPNLMQRYKADLEKARRQMLAGASSMGALSADMMQAYVDGLISLVADSDRVIVTFEITKDVAAIDLALVPRAGTRLGKFVTLQQPSDYGLLGKLPAAPAPMLIAGKIDTGPYRTGMLELGAQFFSAAASKDMAAAMGAVLKAATGDFAMTMQMAGPQGMSMTQLFGVTDPKTADKAIGALLDIFKTPRSTTMMGMTQTITTNPKSTVHDGVTLRGYDTVHDLSKAAPANRAVWEKMFPKSGLATRGGTFDKLAVVAAAADGTAAAAAVIDAARGKGARFTPPAVVGDFLAGSRARKESIVMVADIGAMAGLTSGRMFMTSFGFADKNAHIRIALPAATLRGFAGQP